VFGHAKQGASCADTKAAGKQVLTNGPSSLAGAISRTARAGAIAGMRRWMRAVSLKAQHG